MAGFTTGADESPWRSDPQSASGQCRDGELCMGQGRNQSGVHSGAGWDGVHGHGEFVVNGH